MHEVGGVGAGCRGQGLCMDMWMSGREEVAMPVYGSGGRALVCMC